MKFSAGLLLPFLFASVDAATGGTAGKAVYFQRIATFLTCTQLDPTCNVDTETSAEIVSASEDGNTLVYTDSNLEVLGFVDISDPANPAAAGYIDVGGEPTSVAVCGPYAIVVVNTSEDFINVSGIYHVIEVATQTVLVTGDLPGQPDSVAVSPDCTRAVVAIENERDEDLGDGVPPQMPPGFVFVMDTSADDPSTWTSQTIDILGLDGVLYADDPEPEFVSINADNIAVVTLQENNAIILIDLNTYTVMSSFSAGAVDLTGIDIVEEDVIDMSGSLAGVLREPDGVVWMGTDYFATANEGDLDGGSRGFSIWSKGGEVVYDSGNTLDHLTAMVGHYPESRSENKGNEPENVMFATYGGIDMLFVNSERSSVIFVYDVSDPASPVLFQILPASIGPEGSIGIPSRDLAIVASEEDARDDKFRGAINIYSRSFMEPSYPMIVSVEGDDGAPIPFAALSGLSACPAGVDYCDMNTLYTVEDSYFNVKRLLTIDTSSWPVEIVAEAMIKDSNGIFSGALASLGFNDTMVADYVNEDMTINVDPEGIAASTSGGFWMVHEGRAPTVNILFKLDGDAVIEDVIVLPDEINAKQIRFGFEGVAEDGPMVVVAFQRAWEGDEYPMIGVWNTETSTWTFYYYPLDAPESQYGGWVGLSDIAPLGNKLFLVLERDNQGGPDAAIKRIYLINLMEPGDEFSVLNKVLVKDVYDDLVKATYGPVAEKIEGLTVDQSGTVWLNNDNDGVDDNSGENLFLNLGTATVSMEGGCEVCMNGDCVACP